VDPGRLGVFALEGAEKAGNSLFTGAAAGQATGTATAGALEGSGVDPARAMVDMIASMRSFEAGQKAIQTIDSTLERAATQVAGLG
jgi:flagellar basal-body rod protein FlgG